MNLRSVVTVTKYVAVISLVVSVTSFIYVYFVVQPATVIKELDPNGTVEMSLMGDQTYEIAFRTERQRSLIKTMQKVEQGEVPIQGNVSVSGSNGGQIELNKSYKIESNKKMYSTVEPTWSGWLLGQPYLFMLYRFSVPGPGKYQVEMKKVSKNDLKNGQLVVVAQPSTRLMTRLANFDVYLMRVPFCLFLLSGIGFVGLSTYLARSEEGDTETQG